MRSANGLLRVLRIAGSTISTADPDTLVRYMSLTHGPLPDDGPVESREAERELIAETLVLLDAEGISERSAWKAAKDYPQDGIQKGDTYYYWYRRAHERRSS